MWSLESKFTSASIEINFSDVVLWQNRKALSACALVCLYKKKYQKSLVIAQSTMAPHTCMIQQRTFCYRNLFIQQKEKKIWQIDMYNVREAKHFNKGKNNDKLMKRENARYKLTSIYLLFQMLPMFGSVQAECQCMYTSEWIKWSVVSSLVQTWLFILVWIKRMSTQLSAARFFSLSHARKFTGIYKHEILILATTK